MPWNYLFLGPNQGVVWHESGFSIHPDWGLPKPRSGKDAVRTHAMEKDAHTQVYQDVSVSPRTPIAPRSGCRRSICTARDSARTPAIRPACA